MSRYTVERQTPNVASTIDTSGGVIVGKAVRWTAYGPSAPWAAYDRPGWRRIGDRTFDSPEAVAAAWGEITGDRK